MLKKVELILCLFIISNSLDIISITNSGQKEIQFTKDKKFFVFEYKNEAGNHSKVKIIKSQQHNRNHNVYIYLNKSAINEKLIKYYKRANFNYSVYTLNINELLREKFYIVISQPYENEENNVSIKIYSSNDANEVINTTVFYKFIRYTSSTQNYAFKFADNLSGKYLKFGYAGNYQIYQTIKFSIYENDQIIYNKEKTLVNEGYITIKNDYSYTINLILSSSDLDFYLVLTDNLYILPVEINTKYFQIFPSLKSLNLSLDTSSIEKNYRFIVQFHYKSVASIRVFGYDTDNYNLIENNQGRQLEMLNENIGQSNYNKSFYIKKDSSKLKRVILRITVPYPGSFEIRYGDEEYYYGESFFASVMFGLGLSLPNIIMQIYRHIYKQKIAPWYSLIMNIILHLAYGNLLSYPFRIGGEMSLGIGYIFCALYLFCFLVCCCNFSTSSTKNIFHQLNNSFKDFEELPILEESVDFNRKIPPKIIIKATSGHIESREILKEYQPYQQAVYREDVHFWQDGTPYTVPHYDHTTINFDHVDSHYSEWKRVDEGGGKIEGKPGDSHNSFVKDVQKREIEAWKGDTEYKYTSWQDNTQNLTINKEFPIIIANFDYKIIFNESGDEGKRKVIDNLCKEGKTHDTDVYYNEEYSCEGMIFRQRCYVNREEYNKIKALHQKKYFYIGIIAFILGYSSIIDCFTFFEEGKDSFIIDKLISDENNCRAEYMKNDEILPEVKYSYNTMELEIEADEKKIYKKGENGNQIYASLLYE